MAFQGLVGKCVKAGWLQKPSSHKRGLVFRTAPVMMALVASQMRPASLSGLCVLFRLLFFLRDLLECAQRHFCVLSLKPGEQPFLQSKRNASDTDCLWDKMCLFDFIL